MKKRTHQPISKAVYERLLEKYPNTDPAYETLTTRQYLRKRINCLTAERDEYGKLTISRLVARCHFNPETLHQYMSENISKKVNIGAAMAAKLHAATDGFLHLKYLHAESFELMQQIA